jgi:hypothetical protein
MTHRTFIVTRRMLMFASVVLSLALVLVLEVGL